MAKIEKLKKDVAGVQTTIYPATIPQAVVDPSDGKLLKTKLTELDSSITGINTNLTALNNNANVKLKNLITNGDFRNGTTGWTAPNGTLSALNNELTHTGNSSTTGTSVISHAFNTIAAHQYYIALSVFRSHDISSMYIEQINGLGVIQLTNTVINEWNFRSFIKSSTANSASSLTLVALFTGSSNLNKLLKIKGFLSVDLTATFGAGNEPTKDEMETLITILGSQYFDGEITLTQKQIMNWELKMIRQNRNAIVALGGTII